MGEITDKGRKECIGNNMSDSYKTKALDNASVSPTRMCKLGDKYPFIHMVLSVGGEVGHSAKMKIF